MNIQDSSAAGQLSFQDEDRPANGYQHPFRAPVKPNRSCVIA